MDNDEGCSTTVVVSYLMCKKLNCFGSKPLWWLVAREGNSLVAREGNCVVAREGNRWLVNPKKRLAYSQVELGDASSAKHWLLQYQLWLLLSEMLVRQAQVVGRIPVQMNRLSLKGMCLHDLLLKPVGLILLLGFFLKR